MSDSNRRQTQLKIGIALSAAMAIIVGFILLRDFLTLESLAKQEMQLRDFQQRHPALSYGLAFAFYTTVTGLSLPGATVLTLTYGWFFGLVRGVVLVSIASTAGATLAFLMSRFLFRSSIQSRFGKRLGYFNEMLARDGPFYLFTLRLVPAVPFFVVNAVMGLTPISALTFWWVSQLGMFPATGVYVYAGATVPSLRTLADEGIRSVFSAGQLSRLLIAFALLGILPLLVRWGLRHFGKGLLTESIAKSDSGRSISRQP